MQLQNTLHFHQVCFFRGRRRRGDWAVNRSRQGKDSGQNGSCHDYKSAGRSRTSASKSLESRICSLKEKREHPPIKQARKLHPIPTRTTERGRKNTRRDHQIVFSNRFWRSQLWQIVMNLPWFGYESNAIWVPLTRLILDMYSTKYSTPVT